MAKGKSIPLCRRLRRIGLAAVVGAVLGYGASLLAGSLGST